MKYATAEIDSVCGPIRCIVAPSGALVSLHFLHSGPRSSVEEKLLHEGHVLKSSRIRTRSIRRQLEEYFKGRRKEFDLELEYSGTIFKQKVWDALRKIPYGRTMTYGEIAAEIGSARAARAVGAAAGANPIPLIIPCHRVIGADGKLTGFSSGLVIKKLLLLLESRYRTHPVSGQLEFDF